VRKSRLLGLKCHTRNVVSHLRIIHDFWNSRCKETRARSRRDGRAIIAP